MKEMKTLTINGVTYQVEGYPPYISEQNTWMVYDTAADSYIDTGIMAQGKQGPDGKSAYQYAQDGGYTGTEQEFAEKLAEKIPDTLPNPYPLTINGKSYDGSEEVNVVVTGSAGSDVTSLGQTPVTLSQAANVRLVGDGEHSYTMKGKTVADISTATVSKTSAILTETEDYIELSVSGSPANWYNTYATFAFSGLTVNESYTFCIESFGLDTSNLNSDGYFLIKNASGTELGRINDTDAGLRSVAFTASSANITVTWYPANNYYWGNDYRTARIGDLYINKTSDGTDRTVVLNESGTFTDTYSMGLVSKGVTISTTPSCEVYTVSGGGGYGGGSLPLEGATVVCFGDSLFGMYTGDNSAPAFVAQKTGATVYNVGFGGCRMSEHPYTGYNEFCMYALANAVASGNWSLQDAAASEGSANFPDQLAILKDIDFNTVDYIVIHYGTNDFAAGGGVAIDNPNNPKATNTLCGALRYSVEKLLGAFPKLKIFVSLPAFRYWTADNGTVTYSDEKKDVNGRTLPEFCKALADTAKEYKLPVIDCYYGLGINETNAATFLPDGTHHNVEGRKRFGEYLGAKLIAGGDTALSAESPTSGDGSASIGVTAEVGQTIVVEEVDANGKPAKWKAAEYQPRTHWTEETVILPEATYEYDAENDDWGVPFVQINDAEYKVIYNGTEYATRPVFIEEGTALAAAFGNTDAFLDIGDNGIPFILIFVSDVEEDYAMFMSMEEVTSVTMSIAEIKHIPIPVQYVSNVLPYYIDVTYEPGETVDVPGTYSCDDTVKNVEANYDIGRNIVVRLSDNSFPQAVQMQLLAATDLRGGIDADGDGKVDQTSFSPYGVTFQFTALVYASSSNTLGKQLFLIPKQDGTYLVSEIFNE